MILISLRIKLYLTSPLDKRFKKYILTLLNISHRIRVRRVDMVEESNALTSLYLNCIGKYSYPTTNLKKLYIYYSVLLCTISKLYHLFNIFSISNSKLNVTNSELSELNSGFNCMINNLYGNASSYYTVFNSFA